MTITCQGTSYTGTPSYIVDVCLAKRLNGFQATQATFDEAMGDIRISTNNIYATLSNSSSGIYYGMNQGFSSIGTAVNAVTTAVNAVKTGITGLQSTLTSMQTNLATNTSTVSSSRQDFLCLYYEFVRSAHRIQDNCPANGTTDTSATIWTLLSNIRTATQTTIPNAISSAANTLGGYVDGVEDALTGIGTTASSLLAKSTSIDTTATAIKTLITTANTYLSGMQSSLAAVNTRTESSYQMDLCLYYEFVRSAHRDQDNCPAHGTTDTSATIWMLLSNIRTATQTTIPNAISAAANTLGGYVDGVEDALTGIGTTASSLLAKSTSIDTTATAIKTLISTTNSYVDGVESALTMIATNTSCVMTIMAANPSCPTTGPTIPSILDKVLNALDNVVSAIAHIIDQAADLIDLLTALPGIILSGIQSILEGLLHGPTLPTNGLPQTTDKLNQWIPNWICNSADCLASIPFTFGDMDLCLPDAARSWLTTTRNLLGPVIIAFMAFFCAGLILKQLKVGTA
jgi:phage-related protein